MKRFATTNNTGFHMTLDNGYTVSVQFGPGHYADNRGLGFIENRGLAMESNTAEVWAFNNETDQTYGEPRGWLSVSEVLAYIAEVGEL